MKRPTWRDALRGVLEAYVRTGSVQGVLCEGNFHEWVVIDRDKWAGPEPRDVCGRGILDEAMPPAPWGCLSRCKWCGEERDTRGVRREVSEERRSDVNEEEQKIERAAAEAQRTYVVRSQFFGNVGWPNVGAREKEVWRAVARAVLESAKSAG